MVKFKSSKLLKAFLIINSILVFWGILTVFSQYYGKAEEKRIGNPSASRTALILYNPDPFYNLDEQVCLSFAEGLSYYDFDVSIVTTQSTPSIHKEADLYVFCTNTYNWAPDWLVVNYIKDQTQLEQKAVVAITLGAGSTERAKRKLEEALQQKSTHLLASEHYWLMKPNDETNHESPNAKLAVEFAKSLGEKIGKGFTLEASLKRKND